MRCLINMMNYSQNIKNYKINLTKYGKLFISFLLFLFMILTPFMFSFADTWDYVPISTYSISYSAWSGYVNDSFGITYYGNESSLYDDIALSIKGLEPNKTYTLYWYPDVVPSYPEGSYNIQIQSHPDYTSIPANSNNSSLFLQKTTNTQPSHYTFSTNSSYVSSATRSNVFALVIKQYIGGSLSIPSNRASLKSMEWQLPTIYIAEGTFDESLYPSSPIVPPITFDELHLFSTQNFLNWNDVEGAAGYRLQLWANDTTPVGGAYYFTNDTFSQPPKAGLYTVQAVGDGVVYEALSQPSNKVYFSGNNTASLDSLNGVGYDSSQNHVYWIGKTGADGYNVYLNGSLVSYHQSDTYYVPDQSGNYQVQWYQGQSVSPLSNVVNVVIDSGGITSGGISSIQKPLPPSDGGVLEWLQYYGNTIEYYWDVITQSISSLFKGAINGISSLFNYIMSFVDSIGSLFSFLPDEILTIIIALIAVLAVFAIIKSLL